MRSGSWPRPEAEFRTKRLKPERFRTIWRKARLR
jgi:hypothetical protein